MKTFKLGLLSCCLLIFCLTAVNADTFDPEIRSSVLRDLAEARERHNSPQRKLTDTSEYENDYYVDASDASLESDEFDESTRIQNLKVLNDALRKAEEASGGVEHADGSFSFEEDSKGAKDWTSDYDYLNEEDEFNEEERNAANPTFLAEDDFKPSPLARKRRREHAQAMPLQETGSTSRLDDRNEFLSSKAAKQQRKVDKAFRAMSRHEHGDAYIADDESQNTRGPDSLGLTAIIFTNFMKELLQALTDELTDKLTYGTLIKKMHETYGDIMLSNLYGFPVASISKIDVIELTKPDVDFSMEKSGLWLSITGIGFEAEVHYNIVGIKGVARISCPVLPIATREDGTSTKSPNFDIHTKILPVIVRNPGAPNDGQLQMFMEHLDFDLPPLTIWSPTENEKNGVMGRVLNGAAYGVYAVIRKMFSKTILNFIRTQIEANLPRMTGELFYMQIKAVLQMVDMFFETSCHFDMQLRNHFTLDDPLIFITKDMLITRANLNMTNVDQEGDQISDERWDEVYVKALSPTWNHPPESTLRVSMFEDAPAYDKRNWFQRQWSNLRQKMFRKSNPSFSKVDVEKLHADNEFDVTRTPSYWQRIADWWAKPKWWRKTHKAPEGVQDNVDAQPEVALDPSQIAVEGIDEQIQ